MGFYKLEVREPPRSSQDPEERRRSEEAAELIRRRMYEHQRRALHNALRHEGQPLDQDHKDSRQSTTAAKDHQSPEGSNRMAKAHNEQSSDGFRVSGRDDVEQMAVKAGEAAAYTMQQSLEGIEFTNNQKNAGLRGEKAKEGLENTEF